MIVKNEEKYLRDCLSSVTGIVDDIVIVDTGSTDNTIDIAKEFGARIFHFPWINDFAAARNFALDQTEKGWILYLDADERLSASSVKELKKITSSYPSKAYHCKVISIEEKDNPSQVMMYPRLFPSRKSVRFVGKIHEQIEDSIHRNKIPILMSKIDIIHIGYNIPIEVLKLKANRNLQLLFEEYKTNPSGYISYQIAQTYGVLNDPIAEKYFGEAIDKGLDKNEYKAIAYRFMAIKNAERTNIKKAEELILLSLLADKNQPSTLIGAANIYLILKDYGKASEYILKAYNNNHEIYEGKGTSFQTSYLNNDSICIYGLHIAIGADNKELFRFFFTRLKENNHVVFNLFNLIINNTYIDPEAIKISIQLLTERYLEALIAALKNYSYTESKINLLTALSDKFPQNPKVLIPYGIVLSESGKLKECVNILESAMVNDPDNPSVVFYLISAYLKTNDIKHVNNLLLNAEKKFAALPAVVSRLELVKQKLFLIAS
jgi:glycosyltransferase involved in cell wall biosynthesis